ncbi:MAG: CDP-glucose 4,6-dehydratase [Deltaproteobacteria bacterium]
MFRNAYKGKKVLITGHTGFKGSWLAVWLRDLGADVTGYSLAPPGEPSNFSACRLQDKITHLEGDVRDLENLRRIFTRQQPEFVFHLAAQALVRESYQDPKLTFDTNIGGTVNVLEAARMTPSVRVLVNVTSDKCYENREWVWGYRENDPLGGHDPYSASKGAAEVVFAAYLKSFFRKEAGAREIGAASVRAGNVIGGGDWGKDRLIPDCIRALAGRKTIEIRNPQAIRPWQHVLEPLSGYLFLGAMLDTAPASFSGAWNFGPSGRDHLTVGQIAEKIAGLWGSGMWKDISSTGDTLHEARTLKLCCDKALAELNWHSTLAIEECLEYLVKWYKLFYENGQVMDMYDICSSQIGRYTASAKKQKLEWSL